MDGNIRSRRIKRTSFKSSLIKSRIGVLRVSHGPYVYVCIFGKSALGWTLLTGLNYRTGRGPSRLTKMSLPWTPVPCTKECKDKILSYLVKTMELTYNLVPQKEQGIMSRFYRFQLEVRSGCRPLLMISVVVSVFTSCPPGPLVRPLPPQGVLFNGRPSSTHRTQGRTLTNIT